ncbi:hypothetical protein [Rhizobium hainanense]|uniref:Uncharacterized protein n=1 Tax=Rhizobium hainanense TaxID=52131 RepID=A0A1C3V920_9HYPH|nr:hypothetical protein [Rhizobium hainanense]SCB24165.1 hypothetical protein GA0061100_1056 [Rhizobium hainanense]
MRYHRWMLIAICVVAFTMLRIGSPIQASGSDMQATVDKPVTIAIAGVAERAPGNGGKRIVVTVNAYEPSKSGSVTIVVSVRCGEVLREIGRFGIFPNEAFSVSRGSNPQRFGFPLPDEPSCRQPQTVEIGLEPQTGDGTGASITIGSAGIE